MAKSKALKKLDGTEALEKAIKSGRHDLLTKEVQDKIIEAISTGGYIETAAAFAGVSKATLYAWMKRGNKEIKHRKEYGKGNKAETKYVQFLDAVQKAIADNELLSIRRLEKAANEGQWKVDQWFLERKHPDKWGSKHQISPVENLKGADDSINEIIAEEIEKLDSDRFED